MGVLSNNYAQIVPGGLISASYVSDIYEVLMGSEPESLKITGSLIITGSIVATTGVTASLLGTSSFSVTASRAISALTASYAVSASYLNYINTSSQADTATTASYALTASQSNISNTATTASYALTASYVVNSISSSLADTSSYAPTYINTASIAGSTLTFTKGNGDQFNISIPGGSVNYGNVYFVDKDNGNDATGVINDFTKPFATVVAAYNAAYSTSPTSTNRALIYVRKGTYTDENLNIFNYIDIYSDYGVVYTGNSRFRDFGTSADTKILGYAKFNVTSSSFQIVTITGAATVVSFECDEIIALGGMFEVQNGASLYFKARKVDADASGFYNSGYCRGSGTIVVEISEEYKSFAQHFKFVQFSGKMYATCPRFYLKSGGGIPSGFKQSIMVDANAGGEAIINGNFYTDPTAGTTAYGTNSAIITRWNDSWMTLIINGNIYSENQLAVHAQGSSASSRTIINGDVKSNFQIAYIAESSRVVFRNGTLLNWNTEATYSMAGQYPIINVNQNAVTYIDNCHLHNLGTGSIGNSGFSGIWKTSTTSQLNVYNSVYSGGDLTGSFILNTVAGTPTNNVRIHNTRASKGLDINITDLLSPTGFILDTNVTSINFI